MSDTAISIGISLVTFLATVIGWIALAAGDRRELVNARKDHERRIDVLEKSSRATDVTIAEMRNDVKWIRHQMEIRNPPPLA